MKSNQYKTSSNNIFIRLILILICISFIGGCATKTKIKKQLARPVMPTEPVDVYWAGFAFLGNWNQRETRYPYTSELYEAKKDGRSVIDLALASRIKGFVAPGYNLLMDLGDTRTGKALSVALALSYEDVYVLPFGGDFKVSYDIAMNVLVFDFDEQKVIAVYPLRFLRNELYKDAPTDRQHKEVIKALFVSNDHGFNLFEESIKRMKEMVIKPSYKNYIGINNIGISDKANKKIPGKLLKDNVVQTQIAQLFEGALSKSAYVPMVPFTKGEAVGGTMAARFSNGDRYEFTLPEKDYLINIELRGFKKKNSPDHQGFTSLITLTLDVDRGDKGVKNKVTAKFSNNIWVLHKMTGAKTKEGQWSIFEESLGKLLNDLAKQIVSTDSEWLKKHSATKDAEDQFDVFRRYLIKSQ